MEISGSFSISDSSKTIKLFEYLIDIKKDYMIRIGFHLSISGDIANAPLEAKQSGYTAFQIFTSNPRSWKQKIIDDEAAQRFKDAVKSSNAEPFAHMPYLCNIASSKEEIFEKSMIMLIENMKNCDKLGIKYLVLHIGSHTGSGEEKGRANMIRGLNTVINKAEVSILLENTAGYKNSMGSKFEDIGKIIDAVDSDKLGMCLDTCHAFAAGYDIRSEKGVDRLCREIESYVGFNKIHLIHLNDSKFDLGSGKDRHWHIGKGYIGEDGFVNLFKNKNFKNGAFVMETPYFEGADIENMNAALRIIKRAATIPAK
jgi:deoxyribonuclease IV